MKYNKEMAFRLMRLCNATHFGVGDVIEAFGLPIQILERYLNGNCDTINEEHLRKLARGLYMSADDLYDMLCGRKPLQSRFGLLSEDSGVKDI
jgi:hypothetical protein